MFSEWIRYRGFWALDAIRGAHVKKHYNDIKECIELKKSPEDRIQDILLYAKKNVPFYFNIKGNSLNDFPVVNKSIYNYNFDDFISNEYKNSNKLHWIKTSGSSGTPFSAPLDMNKRHRMQAEVIYYYDICGWHLGERYLFIRTWITHKAPKWKCFVQNFIPYEASNFSNKSKDELLKIIKNDKKLKRLLGYSSAVTDLANYIQEKEVGIKNIQLVFVDSDELLPGAKEKIQKVFGCPVINRYSNEENGVLACMKSNDDFWSVNTASYYIELLKLNEDKPCEPGEIGRVVVTDLTNHAMPFIRYDIGDLACSYQYNGKYLTCINSLDGRSNNMIKDTSGNIVSNAIISETIKPFNILKYQLIQNNIELYTLKLILKPEVQIKKTDVVSKLLTCLGDNAKINVCVVDEIETSNSGKYKPTISYLQ